MLLPWKVLSGTAAIFVIVLFPNLTISFLFFKSEFWSKAFVFVSSPHLLRTFGLQFWRLIRKRPWLAPRFTYMNNKDSTLFKTRDASFALFMWVKTAWYRQSYTVTSLFGTLTVLVDFYGVFEKARSCDVMTMRTWYYVCMKIIVGFITNQHRNQLLSVLAQLMNRRQMFPPNVVVQWGGFSVKRVDIDRWRVPRKKYSAMSEVTVFASSVKSRCLATQNFYEHCILLIGRAVISVAWQNRVSQ